MTSFNHGRRGAQELRIQGLVTNRISAACVITFNDVGKFPGGRAAADRNEIFTAGYKRLVMRAR